MRYPSMMAAHRRTPHAIDAERLFDALYRMPEEQQVALALDLLSRLPPKEQIAALRPYVDVARLRPSKTSLVDDVRAFDRAVRAGGYHDAFRVDSRTFMQQSEGTTDFIRDCLRLLDRAVGRVEQPGSNAADVRECFETIFALLRRVDAGEEDVFFADEQSSLQVGVPWERVFPAWFACLAPTAAPAEFARLVVEWVDAFEAYRRTRHFTAARKVASVEQQRALRAHLAATRKANVGRRRRT